MTGRFLTVLLLAAATGWVSLSQEILWVRVVSGADENRPAAFAHVLAAVLAGLAAGALIAGPALRRTGLHPLRLVALALGTAGVAFWLAPALGADLLTRSEPGGLIFLLGSAALVALLIGGAFPVLCDYGVSGDAAVGVHVSRVYLANILGATAGPLLTGFVLLEVETLENNILFLGLAGVALAEVVWLALPGPRRGRVVGGAVAAVVMLTMVAGHARLYDGFLEKLHFGDDTDRYAHVAQGRAGVVGVLPDGRLFGEGLYDGAFDLDPLVDRNMITRAYMVAALHPAPRRVLEIGLGSGSWARAMADHPAVEELTVVEINPAYVDVVWHYPDVASVLEDPRVTVHFDDARRWLNRRPEARFDAIVVNGTWHWRAHATHLLSAEFLQVMRAHLAPGGLVYFNTTGSDDAAYTAAGVFRHVTRYLNFIAASDRPLDIVPPEERKEALLAFAGREGQTFAGAEGEALAAGLAALELEDLAPELRLARNLWYITEDNMATEFKSNGPGAWWRALPARAWRPDRAWHRVLF